MNTIADQVKRLTDAPLPVDIAEKLQRAKKQHERFMDLIAKGLIKKREFNLPGRQEIERDFYLHMNRRSAI